jgi:hypothetical protein
MLVNQSKKPKGVCEMKSMLNILTPVFALFITFVFTQSFSETDTASVTKRTNELEKRYSLGNSLFLLGNLPSNDRPYYFMLNFSHQINNKNILFTEAITWTYYEPLGTYGSSKEHYPGKIRAYGIGAGYQHFLWKKLYVTAQVTPFYQQFFDIGNKKIADGFQLYLQSRLGYRFEFFKKRWFIEPSIAENYWPVNTNFPAGFSAVENGKPNYYLFEPGMNFGFKF